MRTWERDGGTYRLLWREEPVATIETRGSRGFNVTVKTRSGKILSGGTFETLWNAKRWAEDIAPGGCHGDPVEERETAAV